MRNLKKVLSLALVFVMVFALMVSAGAAYSDQSKIENKEAVEMVTALKIMQGRNGAFDPTAPVQRGELAKMLYVASTGSDDGAVLYASYQNKFTDVPNTVASTGASTTSSGPLSRALCPARAPRCSTPRTPFWESRL